MDVDDEHSLVVAFDFLAFEDVVEWGSEDIWIHCK